MSNMYSEWSQNYMILVLFSEFFAVIIIFILSMILFKRFVEKKKPEVKYLMIVMHLMYISIIMGIIPQILAAIDSSSEFQYGIPLSNQNYLWWDNIAYSIMSFTMIFLVKFMQILFKKPTKREEIVIWVLIILFNIFNIYYGIFHFVQGESSLSPITSLLFGVLALYCWGSLFFLSRLDFRKIDKSVYQFGLKLISISALCMLLCFGLWASN